MISENLSMMGVMLFVIANGSGPISVESLLFRQVKAPTEGKDTQGGALEVSNKRLSLSQKAAFA